MGNSGAASAVVVEPRALTSERSEEAAVVAVVRGETHRRGKLSRGATATVVCSDAHERVLVRESASKAQPPLTYGPRSSVAASEAVTDADACAALLAPRCARWPADAPRKDGDGASAWW